MNKLLEEKIIELAQIGNKAQIRLDELTVSDVDIEMIGQGTHPNLAEINNLKQVINLVKAQYKFYQQTHDNYQRVINTLEAK